MERVSLQMLSGKIELSGDQDAFIELANLVSDAKHSMEKKGYTAIASRYRDIWLQIERQALGYDS